MAEAEQMVKSAENAYWIDTHCHLDFDCFAAERDAVVARALAANVRRQITISTRIAEVTKLIAIAEAYPSVFFSVGSHPGNAHEAAEQKVALAELLRLTAHPKCVGIGEAGLDYHYNKDTAAEQAKSLRLHIAAARQTGLPLIIHSREADADMAAILLAESGQGAFPFILHCYSSGPELAKTGLELGGYISFSGIATFKNAPGVREVAAFTPADRILVETDAPYLAPVPYRGQTNEPSFVAKTGEFLADFLHIDRQSFAAQTSENAYRLFSKMARA